MAEVSQSCQLSEAELLIISVVYCYLLLFMLCCHGNSDSFQNGKDKHNRDFLNKNSHLTLFNMIHYTLVCNTHFHL